MYPKRKVAPAPVPTKQVKQMQAKHSKLVKYQRNKDQSSYIHEACDCPPLSSLHKRARQEPHETHCSDEERGEQYPSDVLSAEHIVPATLYLKHCLHSALEYLLPHSRALSILLLHVSQCEHALLKQEQPSSYKRFHSHPPAGFLEQLLVNVRRVIRDDDQLLIHQDIGAALVLPEVDQRGAQVLLERVYNSISLLQAETVIPPLTRETHIVLGCGTLPEQGATIEQLLYHTGLVAREIVFRPAITTQFLAQASMAKDVCAEPETEELPVPGSIAGVPFMALPTQVPVRLRQLIPHQLAVKMRCAPVGRDHHALTIAMVNPLDHETVQRLQALTGMTIFPVSCTEKDLDTLLANKW